MKLTPKAAAAKLCVSVSLVYGLLKSRKLRAYRIGVRGKGKWLIDQKDLDEYLESCKPMESAIPDDGQMKHIR